MQKWKNLVSATLLNIQVKFAENWDRPVIVSWGDKQVQSFYWKKSLKFWVLAHDILCNTSATCNCPNWDGTQNDYFDDLKKRVHLLYISNQGFQEVNPESLCELQQQNGVGCPDRHWTSWTKGYQWIPIVCQLYY